MKLLIDKNVSRLLISTIEISFPGSPHVADQNLTNVWDREIWNFAKEKDFCILTKDWDYKFLSMTFGCPPKVIHLNCGNKATSYIAELIKNKTVIIKRFLYSVENCYLEIE